MKALVSFTAILLMSANLVSASDDGASFDDGSSSQMGTPSDGDVEEEDTLMIVQPDSQSVGSNGGNDTDPDIDESEESEED